MVEKGIGFGIDCGGTFTNVFVIYPEDNKTKTFKLLSEDRNYKDAPTETIRRILNEYMGKDIKRDEKIPTENISFIRMGMTFVTNVLLERKGERTALLITWDSNPIRRERRQQQQQETGRRIGLSALCERTINQQDQRKLCDSFHPFPRCSKIKC
ncbi:Hydant-A-N domain-containing protein [Aphelenchoides besseyi]|nr:Hydant-A-N domain-containing protein [Aphelenchoides besseyi]KAI6198483.1 Hydant-A-N domain-containing protein [Aphelenchoides besseyi]